MDKCSQQELFAIVTPTDPRHPPHNHGIPQNIVGPHRRLSHEHPEATCTWTTTVVPHAKPASGLRHIASLRQQDDYHLQTARTPAEPEFAPSHAGVRRQQRSHLFCDRAGGPPRIPKHKSDGLPWLSHNRRVRSSSKSVLSRRDQLGVVPRRFRLRRRPPADLRHLAVPVHRTVALAEEDVAGQRVMW